ncbi:hypothetical protein BN2476_1380008 [Paraburkholderia piptadeniae]|uniref:Uncharacterized protein n=1 Tax=Paraburkholderia piptadeniae TaxID=1701573 RepID=A0A1N7SXU3_9BURK|nr:hypothetical protein BN2476_1380008 [Paraburkholderia piptadeniae]
MSFWTTARSEAYFHGRFNQSTFLARFDVISRHVHSQQISLSNFLPLLTDMTVAVGATSCSST